MVTRLSAKKRHLPYGITQCCTYHPTQVNQFCLNHSQRGRYSNLYLLNSDGCKAELTLVVGYTEIVYQLIGRQTVTHPST